MLLMDSVVRKVNPKDQRNIGEKLEDQKSLGNKDHQWKWKKGKGKFSEHGHGEGNCSEDEANQRKGEGRVDEVF